MKLSTLAIRNIKQNVKKYAMYIFSLSFSVFTTYSFLALIQNDLIKQAFIYDRRYEALLTSFSVIILVFVLFFLINSNNSFIRARKKEISTYALFGMSNGKIGKLLFLETLFIGVGTLIIGVAAGIFFSKLIAMILLDMTLASYTGDIAFSIDLTSIVITVAIFLVIFSIMGLSGLRVISKFQLVDLFKGEKVAEIKTKGSYFGLVFSLGLTGCGYYLASSDDPEKVNVYALMILAFVILGTYMFFWTGLPKIVHLVKGNKGVYFQGANLISTSSLSHRMLSISSTMATIAVLSAVATTAIATGFTLYSNVEENTYEEVGYDLYFYYASDETVESVHEVLGKNSGGITDEYAVPLYRTSPEMDDVWVGTTQYISAHDNYFRIYRLSEFNQIAAISKGDLEPLFGLEAGTVAFARSYYNPEFREAVIGHELHFSGKTMEVSLAVDTNIGTFGALHTIVVTDEDYDSLVAAGDIYDAGDGKAYMFNYRGALSNRELNDELNQILGGGNVGSYRTAMNHFNESMETFGLVCFIGFFMSVVFILMTASLLYFKQVMAAEEEKHQFKMLRKIGMDYRVEKKVITKRLFPVFVIPLVVGIIHSVFAMKAADTIVFQHLIQEENTYASVLLFSAVMYALYAIIYGVFYYITKGQFSRIVGASHHQNPL